MPVMINEVNGSSSPPAATGTAASRANDEQFIQKVAQRVWELWRAEVRRERERSGQYSSRR